MSVNPSNEAEPTLTSIVVRGGGAALLANVAAQLVRLGATLVLSRLLIPAEFGLFAMINATLGVAQMLRDLGLSAATIRAATLTDRQISTLFWINAAFGLLLCVAIAAASPCIAQALRQPQTASAIALLAFTFAFGGLATQHLALLTRRLAFMTQARITLAAAVLGQSAAIVLAWQKAGLFALIAGVLIADVLVLTQVWLNERWRPSFVAAFAETRALFVFGGYVAATNVLRFLTTNVHVLLIGTFIGAAQAGYFNRAWILIFAPIFMLMLPVGQIITTVLARAQAQPSAFAHRYLKSTSTLMLLNAPLGFFTLAFAPQLVRLLLGPAWSESGVLLRLMSLSLLLQPVMFSAGWVYAARGRAREAFRWVALSGSLILLSYGVGLPWGARGVATAHSVSMLLLVYPCMKLAFRGTEIVIAELWRRILPMWICAALASAPAWAAYELLHQAAGLAALPIAGVAYGFAYLGLLLLTGEKSRVQELWQHLYAALQR